MADFQSKVADLNSHRIEGFAAANGGQFSVPLISQIDGNLWSGGCQSEAVLPQEFKFVVSLYPWERYTTHEGTHESYNWLFDHGTMPNVRLLTALADWVNHARAIGPTLVHCQAGLNRSGLVVALALIRGGMKPTDAIALIRAKRCDMCLCNSTFERWLLAYEAPELEWEGKAA